MVALENDGGETADAMVGRGMYVAGSSVML